MAKLCDVAAWVLLWMLVESMKVARTLIFSDTGHVCSVSQLSLLPSGLVTLNLIWKIPRSLILQVPIKV